MILNETVTAIAEAIREKTGKNDLIAPVDFAEEIKSISVGGGESGGSNVVYLDLSGLQGYMKNTLIYYSVLVKIQGDSVVYGVQIQPSGFVSSVGGLDSLVTAVAIDLAVPITKYVSDESGVEKQELSTLEELGLAAALENIPHLTKEQFYDLNV